MGARIGEAACLNPACGCTDAAVEQTSHGTWQMKCHKCSFTTFAKTGTKWRRDLEKLVKLDEGAEPAPPPAPRGDPKPAPAPARAPRSVFDLGQLA